MAELDAYRYQYQRPWSAELDGDLMLDPVQVDPDTWRRQRHNPHTGRFETPDHTEGRIHLVPSMQRTWGQRFLALLAEGGARIEH